MSDSWDHEIGDEQERRPLILPLIATAVAAGLLLFLAFAVPRGLDTGHNDSSIIGGLVSGCLVGILLWGVAFGITIRRASGGLQVGTLLFTLAVGIVSQVTAISVAAHRISGDMATVARQYRAMGTGDQPPERVPEGTGPVSRISAVFMNGILLDRRTFDHEAERLGVLQILSHEGLSHSSPVLRRCADFEALAVRARTIGDSGWEGHFTEARRIADEAVRNSEMTGGDADSFFAGAAESRDTYRRQWALDAEMVEDAQELCDLFARRPWSARGIEILFPVATDLERARFHLERIRVNAAEQRITADAARRHMGESAARFGS